MGLFEQAVNRILRETHPLPPPGPVKPAVYPVRNREVPITKQLVVPPYKRMYMVYDGEKKAAIIRVEGEDHIMLMADGTWKPLKNTQNQKLPNK